MAWVFQQSRSLLLRSGIFSFILSLPEDAHGALGEAEWYKIPTSRHPREGGEP